MKTHHSCAPPRDCAAFTLVEIMVVVAIIGLLVAIAMPAMFRVRQTAQNNRFLSDLRTFAQAFESYALTNGTWPPNAGNGSVPTGMSGEFNRGAWTSRNSLGGQWNWDRNNLGVAAGISTTNVTASDAQMTLIDAQLDDGDLTSGMFQKVSSRFVYFLEP